MSDAVSQSTLSHVKHSRITQRMPKGCHRKSTGLCKCGASRHNPKDAYCRECRKDASAIARDRAREELKRLRALENQQKLSKGNDNDQSGRRPQETTSDEVQSR